MDEYIDRAVAVSQANFIHGRWDDVYVSAATRCTIQLEFLAGRFLQLRRAEGG